MVKCNVPKQCVDGLDLIEAVWPLESDQVQRQKCETYILYKGDTCQVHVLIVLKVQPVQYA